MFSSAMSRIELYSTQGYSRTHFFRNFMFYIKYLVLKITLQSKITNYGRIRLFQVLLTDIAKGVTEYFS